LWSHDKAGFQFFDQGGGKRRAGIAYFIIA
jgi:hypothetical protein